MKKLKLIVLILFTLGGLSLGLHYSVLPFSKSLPLSQLSQEADGLLSAELAPPWPLKINKRGLSEISVELSDGTILPRLGSRIALSGAGSGQGFYINRPQVFIKLPPSIASGPDARVELHVPVKLRELVHKILLSMAFVLGLWVLLKDGLLALSSGKAVAMMWASGASLVLAGVGVWLLISMDGIAIWIGFGIFFGGFLALLAAILVAGETLTGRRSRVRELLVSALLLVTSSFLGLAGAEGYLALADPASDEQLATGKAPDPGLHEDWFQLPQQVVEMAMGRSKTLTMPTDWERQRVELAGASKAYNWHGALHIRDVHGFRRLNQPFPDKRNGTLRIMVVGDSLTYGYGIDEDWTYSRLLERALVRSYDVEVFNLGRSGYQSADIYDVVETFLPQLQPDLLIYGVCLNDFLPSGQGEYVEASFPLPDSWKSYFLDRTELAKLLSDGYNSLLLMLDIRQDFYDDILSQDAAYTERFAADVRAMNRFADENGLPPVVGIVFHQFFGEDTRAWTLIETAEESLQSAGFDLISIQPWRQELEGKDFPVSRWEGHPNELAHSLVAKALYERLMERGYAKGYERAEPPFGNGLTERTE